MASSAAATALRARAPTHEEILRGMDSSIRDYLDQSSETFIREYGRTKSHLTPQDVKDEKKYRAQERIIAEDQKKLSNLESYGLTHFMVFYSSVDKSGPREEVYKKLHASFLR